MKKIISLLVIMTIMLVSVMGCSASDVMQTGDTDSLATETGSDDAENKTGDTELKIGVSTNSLENLHNRKQFESVQNAAKEAGIETMATNANGSAEQQASDIENLVQNGCNVIVVQNGDSSVLGNVVKEASESGIYIISQDSGSMEGVSVTVEMNNFEASAALSMLLASEIGYSGEVFVMGHNDHPAIRARKAIFEPFIGEYSGMELVQTITTGYPGTRELAYSGVESALLAHPDAKAVFCTQDEEAIAIIEATKAMGVYPDIKCIGFDGQTEVLEDIRDGGCVVGTLYVEDVEASENIVEIAQKLIDGENVSKFVSVPYTVITQENAAEYIEKSQQDEEMFSAK